MMLLFVAVHVLVLVVVDTRIISINIITVMLSITTTMMAIVFPVEAVARWFQYIVDDVGRSGGGGGGGAAAADCCHGVFQTCQMSS